MADMLYELVMNRNPMIKTRNYGILSVNITRDGRVMITWGDKRITMDVEKAEKFFAGCLMMCEIARRLGDDAPWNEYWDRKLGSATRSTRKAAKKTKSIRAKVREIDETEEEEEGAEESEEEEVDEEYVEVL